MLIHKDQKVFMVMGGNFLVQGGPDFGVGDLPVLERSFQRRPLRRVGRLAVG